MEIQSNRITPNNITELKSNEIFVFGSNLAGHHSGGAARTALEKFGAIYGQGTGLQGQSYGIPTMHGPIASIKPYIDEFINFAKQHSENHFLVTRIGCGIAGFKDEQIAPLFKDAMDVENIWLPQSFWAILQGHKSTLTERIGNLFSKPDTHKKNEEFMVEALLSAHKTQTNHIDKTTDINRFLQKQESDYPIALKEVTEGYKQSHWIWYIFPQMKGLGHSEMSLRYGIVSREEAEEYLNNDTLRERLIEITKALLLHSGKKSANEIFSSIDAMKVRSCMTLFDAIRPNDIFAQVLHDFYKDERCKRTLHLLEKEQ